MQQVVQPLYLLLNDLRYTTVDNGRSGTGVLGRDGYLRQGNIRIVRNGKPDQRQTIKASPTIAQTTSRNQVRWSEVTAQDHTRASTIPPASSQRSPRLGGVAMSVEGKDMREC